MAVRIMVVVEGLEMIPILEVLLLRRDEQLQHETIAVLLKAPRH